MARRILFLLVVALIAWLTAPLQAAGRAAFVFQTDMFGSEQVPPVNTGAWGFVRFFFSDDRLQADYTVDVKGLSGNLVEGADIHRGAPGTNGPVIKHLADGGFIVTAGQLTLTQDELNDMVSGVWYVSLKTKDHPAGELRGQIVVPEGFLPNPGATAPPPAGREPGPSSDASAPAGPAIRAPNTGDAGLAAGGGQSGRSAAAGLLPVIGLAAFAWPVPAARRAVRPP